MDVTTGGRTNAELKEIARSAGIPECDAWQDQDHDTAIFRRRIDGRYHDLTVEHINFLTDEIIKRKIAEGKWSA